MAGLTSILTSGLADEMAAGPSRDFKLSWAKQSLTKIADKIYSTPFILVAEGVKFSSVLNFTFLGSGPKRGQIPLERGEIWYIRPSICPSIRTYFPPGYPLDPSGRPSDPYGRPSDPSGRPSDPSVWPSNPSVWPLDPFD